MVGKPSLFTPQPVFYGRNANNNESISAFNPQKGGPGGFTIGEQLLLRRRQQDNAAAAAAAEGFPVIPVIIGGAAIVGLGLVLRKLLK